MTLLFVGGEDTSFSVNAGSLNFAVTTGATSYRSATGYARCALTVSGQSAANPPNGRLRTLNFGTQSTVWVHGWVAANSANTANYTLIGCNDSGSVQRIAVRATGTAGSYKLSTCNAAGTYVDLVTFTASAMTTGLVKVDLQIVYSASGTLNFYVNDVLAGTYSGNLVTDAATGIAQIDFASAFNAASGTTAWSELIVATTDTRPLNLGTIAPAANGNTNTWTGVVASVNKTTINDASSILTASNSQQAQYTESYAFPSGSWAVVAFVQEARVQVGASGPQHFAWDVRTTDGTDHFTGSVAPTTVFDNYGNQMWLTNPFTGSAWVPADFGAGFNFGIESLA